MTTTKQILAAITSVVRAAAAAGFHKGDIQDAVWAVVFRLTGRKDLTIDEAAHAHRVLVRTGITPECGFAARTDAHKASFAAMVTHAMPRAARVAA